MFEVISLFGAELEEPKIGISGKGLTFLVTEAFKVSWKKKKMLLSIIFAFFHVFVPTTDKFYYLSKSKIIKPVTT